jgi:site-specific DNA-methyltransferase (adenine-specific)
MKLTDKITITNEDNMALMARYHDKYFDLAIVDPPYGINKSLKGWGKDTDVRPFGRLYREHSWVDELPTKEYFDELFRVSKNQIIWGGNYMTDFLTAQRDWIIWDKKQSDAVNFSMHEMAWTSFNHVPRLYREAVVSDKLHPTQKPIGLYKWLLTQKAKDGDKILDTHLGSGSIAIACHDYGFELTACELDAEYYEKAIERIKNHVAQQKLF